MHEGNRFKSKTLGKSLFHFQNDPTGHGPAGQFRLLESALKNLRPTDDVVQRLVCALVGTKDNNFAVTLRRNCSN